MLKTRVYTNKTTDILCSTSIIVKAAMAVRHTREVDVSYGGLYPTVGWNDSR